MSYDLKKAGYDAEVNTAKAEADLAYDLKVCSFVELNLSDSLVNNSLETWIFKVVKWF